MEYDNKIKQRPSDIAYKAMRYVLAPKAGRCPYCRRELGEDKICDKCRERLNRLLLRNTSLSQQRSKYLYTGMVKSTVIHLKFERKRLFADVMGDEITDLIPEDAEIITYVPLYYDREKKRGFDQAELIARRVAENKGLPCLRLAVRVRDTYPQSLILTDGTRTDNMDDAFEPFRFYDVTDKTVVLIDDVFTTGATMKECSAAIEQLGPKKIYWITFAEGAGGDDNVTLKDIMKVLFR